LGVIGDLASCGRIPLPAFGATLLTGCHYVAIILAAVSFGHRTGVAVAAVVAFVHVTIGVIVCARPILEQGEAATFVLVGLLGGLVTRHAPMLGESRFARPSLVAPGQYDRGEESRTMLTGGSSQISQGFVHAVRAPLAVIESAGYVLEETALTGENHREVAAIILKECHRLDVLTRSLEFVQPRSPAYCEIQLSSLVDEIFLLASPVTEAVSIMLRRAEGPDLRLICDPHLIEQAILNIITNALRFVGQGEEMVLSAHIDKGDAMIKISHRREGVLGYLRIPMSATPQAEFQRHSRELENPQIRKPGSDDRGKQSR
jgi:signal transduction histidine kinase